MGRHLFEQLRDTLSGKRAARRPPPWSAFPPRLEVLETREVPSAAPLLHVSSNGRFLVDPNNQPVYLVGDTVWTLAVGLNETQAGQYMQTRAAQGFNAFLMDDVVQVPWSPRGPADSNGNMPFTSSLPGSSDFDVTTPNPAYWQHIDNLVNMASQNGLQVLFDVYDNYNGFLGANSTANLKAYGQFLGQRYVNNDNIIWTLGNDYFETPQGDAQMGAVMQSIRKSDTRHLMTLEGWYTSDAPHTSFDNPNLRQYVDVNGIYWYRDSNSVTSGGPFRPEYLAQYNRSDFGPNINIESGYEYRDDLGVTPA